MSTLTHNEKHLLDSLQHRLQLVEARLKELEHTAPSFAQVSWLAEAERQSSTYLNGEK